MSSSRPAGFAVVVGLLGIVAIPAAAAVSAYTSRWTLLQCVYVAVPVAFVAGLCSFSASRRARARLERSVRRQREGLVRAGRWSGLTGLYLAVTGGLALGFYGLLHLTS
jgi:protein-S-isoprenylcysteine O-methyltransferase Ste14